MSVCDLPGISDVCQGTTAAGDSLAALPFEWLAQALGDTAKQAVDLAWSAMTTTTLVDVQAPGYLSVYNLAFGIAVIVMLGLFLLQLIGGMIHREPGALTRAVTGLTKAVFGSFLAVTLIAITLQATDELSAAIVQAAGTTMDALGARLAAAMLALTATANLSPAAGALIGIFLGGLALSGAGILWLSLLVRKALILVVTVIGPFALAGWAWDSARSWPSRWMSVLLALIVSKLLVTILFLVAITQLDSPLGGDLADLSQPVAGIVILALAAFAPYMAYKLLSFVGIDTYHMTSLEAESKSALNRPVPVASGMPMLPDLRRMFGSGSPAGGGSSGAAPAMAPELAAGEASAAATGAEAGAAGAATAATGAGAALLVAEAVGQKGQQVASAGPDAGAALGGIAAAQQEAVGGDRS